MAPTRTNVQAAVPAYLDRDFREAAPGHRFSLYLRLWDEQWNKVSDGPSQAEIALGDEDRRRAQALVERQKALIADTNLRVPESVLSLPAISTAPFTTGLGIEHPLENGFAFLSPYGLPYLPGSSIKGVLRAAARELDDGGAFKNPERSWQGDDIERLFGTASEDTADDRRGALIFHDVFPRVPDCGNLEWDIIAPHQRDYHADPDCGAAPHDNKPPQLVHFLTVPAGSRFRFIIECNDLLLTDTDLLQPSTDGQQPRWQQIVHELLEHAFNWLGFGAKTAVGYGAMKCDERRRKTEDQERERQREERRREEERAALPPAERRAVELLEGKSDASYPDYRYLLEQLEAGDVDSSEAPAIAEIARKKLIERRNNLTGPKKKRERHLQQIKEEAARLQKFLGDT